jgi:hypothetical protein
MSDFAKSKRCQELFNEMLERFQLSARLICQASGVSEVMVSRFRNGNVDLGSSKLVALIQSLPPEAKDWYLSQLFGSAPKETLRSLIDSASTKEKGEILIMIAMSLQDDDTKATEPTQLISTL